MATEESIGAVVLSVAPPSGEKKYQLPLFTLFRPLSPAFSFADVDTFDSV